RRESQPPVRRARRDRRRDRVAAGPELVVCHRSRPRRGWRADGRMNRSPMSNPFDLTDRVVIVTGASSGFGERFARVLHDAGASVVMAARRVDRLQVLADELPGSMAVACDVTSEDDSKVLV